MPENLSQIYASGRESLIDFCVLTDRNYIVNWHHRLIADELMKAEALIRSGSDKTHIFILEVPPRMGKSELASIKFPAWFLGRNPDREIICTSYSKELSTEFGRKTKDLVTSQEYKAVFSSLVLRDDSQAKSHWVTEEGGGFFSTGVGGTLTGKGCHFLAIDDPTSSREEADSKVFQDKVWSWFRSTAMSRLEPSGVVFLIMQRWHKEDLVGKIKAEFGDDPKIVIHDIKFPALATQNELHRMRGEPLWPERYSKEKMESIRRTVGEVAWNSQYQQEPVNPEDQEFRREWFRYFEEKELEGMDEYSMAIDLATGDKEVRNGDDNVIAVGGRKRGRQELWVPEIVGGKWNPMELCEHVFRMNKIYRPNVILIEKNGYQQTFRFWLEEESRKRGIVLPIRTVAHTSSKGSRIRGLLPLFRLGLLKTREGFMKLESQLLNFPQDTHDDFCDVVAMLLEAVGNFELKEADREYELQADAMMGKQKPYVEDAYRMEDWQRRDKETKEMLDYERMASGMIDP